TGDFFHGNQGKDQWNAHQDKFHGGIASLAATAPPEHQLLILMVTERVKVIWLARRPGMGTSCGLWYSTVTLEALALSGPVTVVAVTISGRAVQTVRLEVLGRYCIS